jgi:outer membrane biosynthesis protein TonB
MICFARTGLVLLALSLGVLLSGCEGFDPTSILDHDFLNTKKRLAGERKPVFPEGTPGVPQGVPKELTKGYQPAEQAEEPQPTARAIPSEPKPEAKAKPKPRPKVVAKPKEDASPPAATAQPAQAQSQVQWPDPPPTQQQPATGVWPGSSPGASGAVAWPDPPPTR